jgi:OmpA-OmpF porin, OOP family
MFASLGMIFSPFTDRDVTIDVELPIALWGDATPGCPTPANGRFAVAVGARANSPRPKFPAELAASLFQGGRNYESFSVIPVDGRPAVTARLDFNPKLYGSKSVRVQAEAEHSFVKRAATAISEARARSPEAAPLAALSLAAREVGPGGAVTLMDSGLQTVAPLDFRQGFLTASPTDISGWLKESHLLPDLKDRTLLLAGLGDTVAPQSSLDEARRADLVAIWKQIGKDAGASCISVVTAPAEGAEPEGLPPVSTVQIPRTQSLPMSCLPVPFTASSSIGFVGDSTAFRDADAADATLKRLAGDIKANKQTVTVTGTAAGLGTDEQQKAFSSARAEAVRDKLLRYGVPVDRIEVKGVGVHFDGFIRDIDAAGLLNPVLAAENRGVILQLHC